MKALTLRPYWAAAVAHLGDDVDHRPFPPPASAIGHRIAIHAGAQTVNQSRLATEVDRVFNTAVDAGINGEVAATALSELTCSAVVAVATVAGWWTPVGLIYRAGGLAGYCKASPWIITGHYAWHLVDVVALPEPVPCKGKQGLWELPAEIEAAVMGQLRKRAGG